MTTTKIVNKAPIAVLMATYNAAKYVGVQIESIINQSYQDWTLFIRDDGSKDNTVNILKEYAQIDRRIIIINDNLGNLGCRDNFFKLLETVDSEYYMFSDADDYWLKDKIEISYRRIKELEQASPDIAVMVHTDMTLTDSNLNVTAQSMWQEGRFNPDKIKSCNYLGIHGFVGGATCIFNWKAKMVSMPFSKDVYLHDLWIGLNVLKNGILDSMHRQTMLYRQHNTNMAGAANEKHLKLSYKLKNIRGVFRVNIATARMLKKIGWGGYLKYLYYKTLFIIKTRSGKCM